MEKAAIIKLLKNGAYLEQYMGEWVLKIMSYAGYKSTGLKTDKYKTKNEVLEYLIEERQNVQIKKEEVEFTKPKKYLQQEVKREVNIPEPPPPPIEPKKEKKTEPVVKIKAEKKIKTPKAEKEAKEVKTKKDILNSADELRYILENKKSKLRRRKR